MKTLNKMFRALTGAASQPKSTQKPKEKKKAQNTKQPPSTGTPSTFNKDVQAAPAPGGAAPATMAISVVPNGPGYNPLSREVVVKFVNQALEKGVPALRAEYRALALYRHPEMTCHAFVANHPAGRNRYQDVPCQDQSRVVLQGQMDYIHANYVGTPVSPRRFICTQGPLDCTIQDFWSMVIQENVENVVMLCNCIETGKLKCAEYFPMNAGESKEFGVYTITNSEKKPLSADEPTVLLSSLQVKSKDGGERNIRHFQWVDWPDRGVPPCRLTSMELLSHVRGTRSPIVVHCSAGIGRTGTIVAIEYILEKIQAKEECLTMADLLKELRNQRAFTIQNDFQYLYIHRVMLSYFIDKYASKFNLAEFVPKYKKFVEEYDQALAA